MVEENIAFKSFYYSLGTTSFRMQNFNQKIEQQLDLLNQFWQKPEYKDEKWDDEIIKHLQNIVPDDGPQIDEFSYIRPTKK